MLAGRVRLLPVLSRQLVFLQLSLGLGACAGLRQAVPARELSIVGVSSQKNEELARQVAVRRVLVRAAQIKNPGSTRFVVSFVRGRPMLKLIADSAPIAASPEVEPRKPRGARALIEIERTPQELALLGRLESAHVEAEASGLDIAVAHDRADRAALRDAILAFARAERRGGRTLTGALTIVNYRSIDSEQWVKVLADVHVAFGLETTVKPKTAEPYFSEDHEEVEPPEEAATTAAPVTLPSPPPASQPAVPKK